MQILGVDFSGAQTDRNTWLARGSLRGNTLSFDSCRPVKRAKLTDELAKCAGPTVAALDFPFSVPREFARFWQRAAPSDIRDSDIRDYARPVGRRRRYGLERL